MCILIQASKVTVYDIMTFMNHDTVLVTYGVGTVVPILLRNYSFAI